MFNINQSFPILFMVIIGGLGSLIGSFFGAAFIFMPADRAAALAAGDLGLPIQAATVEHSQFMIVGALIIFFLIVEPHGLARLWQIGKQKLQGVAVSLLNGARIAAILRRRRPHIAAEVIRRLRKAPGTTRPGAKHRGRKTKGGTQCD